MKKKLIRAFVIAIAGAMLLTAPVLAIANPDDITVHTVKVFQNVFEANDILFVSRYDVKYDPTPEPDEPAGDAFQYKLHHGSGFGTLVASRPMNYYQHNVISLYLDATQATAVTWGDSDFNVQVTGNVAMFGIGVEDTKVLASADWLTGTESETETLLYIHCIELAEVLEADWQIDDPTIYLVTTTAEGDALTPRGRIVFTEAIPGLDVACPALFQMAAGTADIGDKATATGAYDVSLSMSSRVGTAIASSFSGIGDYLGISGQMAGGLFLGLIAVTVASIVFISSGNTIAAMVLTIPFVILGNWTGLVPLVFTFVVAIIIVTYTGYHLWLRGI